jgi:hypothetical protein
MADKLTVAAYKTNANGGTQITIEQTDENGRGWGRRLAGPKHYNMGTKTLVSADLDERDAAEIRGMLDAVFPLTEDQVRANALDEAVKLLIHLSVRTAKDDPEYAGLERALTEVRALRDRTTSGLTAA